MLDAVCTHVTSSAALSDSAVKLTTDLYQFWIAHYNLRVTFQSHKRFARKVQKYGYTFSKSSSIFISQGHNFYKLKYISFEEVKIVPFQQ